MSPDEDVIARGRAIFERLRSEQGGDPLPAPDLAAGPAAEAAPDDGEAVSAGPQGTDAGQAPAPDGATSSPPEGEGTTDRAEPSSVDGAASGDDLAGSAAEEPEGEASAAVQASEPGAAGGEEGPEAAAGPEEPAAVEAAEAVETAAADPLGAAPVGPAVEPMAAPPFELPGEEPEADGAPLVTADQPDEQLEEPEPAAGDAEQRSPFDRPLPRIMAVANQKGGVGKTTTAVNLSAGLAELGYRVLVIDLDPQGNATTGLGVNARSLDVSIYDVLIRDAAVEDCIEPTAVKGLFVVPATIDLAGAEIELVPAFSRELKLRKALEAVADDFDFTIIDCPPSLGLLTINALAAAQEVVVPIQCEYYALEGLGQLLRSVGLVKTNLNPSLDIGAIVLTMYDARTKLADQVTGQVREHFGAKVCRNVVPRTVRLSEAPSFGQPIMVFDPSSRGAIAYRELAKEVSGGAPQRVG